MGGCYPFAPQKELFFTWLLVIFLPQNGIPARLNSTTKSIFVDDFVVALCQLAMNLHTNAHELEKLLLIKQLTHLRRELHESEGGTPITRIATNLSSQGLHRAL